ncbi:hypothetical protein ABOM_001470 [Aspergillus bombycis]|uniref:Uncharacterized protein n=1 Tax=Aspergillus bombycis TaxID=109264 RepID=A0A1F8AF03_9EURO|nr:hypothetical protein ABOM_001470 [Aspergillus bombycis]OGM49925.1 hypothetical protein ABOM_001470 [Aspergillus bombycis]
MVDWANVRWWVSFATSDLLGGLSPAKDWLKHMVPVLWPKDKAKVNPESAAEQGTQMIRLLEDLEPLLTNARDLCSSLEAQGTQAKERVALVDAWEIRLDEREIRLNKWSASVKARETSLDAREALVAERENEVGAREAASTLEEERNLRVLNDFLSDIEGILRGPGDRP